MSATAFSEHSQLPGRLFRSASRSDVGKVREVNQDSHLVLEESRLRIYAVADGVGGGDHGDEASELALQTFSQEVKRLQEVTSDGIKRAVGEAHSALVKRALLRQSQKGMCTTLAAVVVVPGRVFLVNVGDSRIYFLHGDSLRLVTKDHTVANQLLQDGLIDPSQAESHPAAHVLVRAVGSTEKPEVDCVEWDVDLEIGDLFLLTTDGLTAVVNDDEIRSVFHSRDLGDAIEALVNRALQRGGPDNITLVAVRIQGSFPMESQSEPMPELSTLPRASEENVAAAKKFLATRKVENSTGVLQLTPLILLGGMLLGMMAIALIIR